MLCVSQCLCDMVWRQHSCWLVGSLLSSLLINSSDIRTAAPGKTPTHHHGPLELACSDDENRSVSQAAVRAESHADTRADQSEDI